MSYATGKQDASDYATFENQLVAQWSAPPFELCPVKLSSTGVVPANSADEVPYGVVHSSQAITDENGATTGYDIKVLIAESDYDFNHGYDSSNYGKILFIQDYTFGAGKTFADAYSTDAPQSGFTHPLFIVVDTDTLHYNGTIRPEAI
jgi:hypothetical protein